jgi:hypothetical protein
MTRSASRSYALAARLTRWWVRRYTRRLPSLVQSGRQAEIDADLWDHWHDRAAERWPTAVALEVVGRLVLGIPADLAWRHAQRRGGPMEPEPLSTADAARVLGLSRRQVVELTTAVPDFPAAAPAPGGGHLWPLTRVEAWATAHPDRGPRHPGPPLFEVGGRSPQVRKVLDLATAHARAHHHPVVGPDDLLDGLVHPDCPGAARAVLASFGITAEQRRRARERSMVDPYEPGTGHVTLPPATQLVLERAHLEAVLLADTEATSEHVLLALASHWARSPVTVASFRRRGMDLTEVRKRVLDLTEGIALPPPPPEQPGPKPDPEVRDVAPGLDLAPTPDGKDPRRRMPWGSMVFTDADGNWIKRPDGQALRQYFVDRDGSPVLTTDGRPVHLVHDEAGQWVLDAAGHPTMAPVEVPKGSAVRPSPERP